MRGALAFGCGLLFAVGLALSGMTLPAKVINFLDVFGAWDPSLAFVMGGALAVNAAAWFFIKRRERPLFADSFALPKPTRADIPLVAGAALFGVGWGLGGYCPGPGIVALGSLSAPAALFVAAMAAGMALQRVTERFGGGR